MDDSRSMYPKHGHKWGWLAGETDRDRALRWSRLADTGVFQADALQCVLCWGMLEEREVLRGDVLCRACRKKGRWLPVEPDDR